MKQSSFWETKVSSRN